VLRLIIRHIQNINSKVQNYKLYFKKFSDKLTHNKIYDNSFLIRQMVKCDEKVNGIKNLNTEGVIDKSTVRVSPPFFIWGGGGGDEKGELLL
jgi:hypothetical protein